MDNITCEEEIFSADAIRFLLIVIIGSLVCMIGIIANLFLLLTLFRLQFIHTNLLYLFLLAAFDILVEICFMLIFPTSLLYDYFQIYKLYYYWHLYIRYISTAGQVLIAASTLLIVAASLERYVSSQRQSAGFSSKQRFMAVIIVICSAIIMKGSVFIELQLHQFPQCPPFSDMRLDLSSITNIEYYKTWWMFYCRSILNVFLPFLLLLFLNLLTVANLKKSSKSVEILLVSTPSERIIIEGGINGGRVSSVRRRKRDATRTLAFLITIYLSTNALNFILTVMEFLVSDYLRNLGEGWTYRYLSDISSLLTISSTALRLPIYLHCNGDIRNQLRQFVQSCFDCLQNKKQKTALEESL